MLQWIKIRIWNLKSNSLLFNSGYNAYCFNCSVDIAGISANQTAGTKLDPAKITRRHGERIAKFMLQEAFKCRGACSSGWFAVIAGPLDLVFVTEYVSKDIVICFGMLVADAINNSLCLVFIMNTSEVGDETRLLMI